MSQAPALAVLVAVAACCLAAAASPTVTAGAASAAGAASPAAATRAGAPGPASAAGAGAEPGSARLELTAEPRRLRLRLLLPQGSLVGFRGVPGDAAEHDEAAVALARLGDAASLFQVDPAAGCGPARVQLDAGPLAPAAVGGAASAAGRDAAATAGAGTSDVAVARYEFDCAAADAAAWLEAPLLRQLPRLRLVHVALTTPRGADRALLSRPLTRIALR